MQWHWPSFHLLIINAFLFLMRPIPAIHVRLKVLYMKHYNWPPTLIMHCISHYIPAPPLHPHMCTPPLPPNKHSLAFPLSQSLPSTPNKKTLEPPPPFPLSQSPIYHPSPCTSLSPIHSSILSQSLPSPRPLPPLPSTPPPPPHLTPPIPLPPLPVSPIYPLFTPPPPPPPPSPRKQQTHTHQKTSASQWRQQHQNQIKYSIPVPVKGLE